MKLTNDLTSIESIKSGDSRFVSKEIDDSRIIPFIKEAQNLDIKNQIGNNLFADLLKYVNSDNKDSFADYSLLLDGGFYEYQSRNGDTLERYFNGLQATLNYFVWARLSKDNPYVITRFGTVHKKAENSELVGREELNQLYLSTIAIAKEYLNDCILFLRCNKDKYPKFNKSYVKNNLHITVIR